MAIENVADLFVATLEQAGVKRIYGIVGDSLNGLTEALRSRGTIEWVHVRHEEVAAFAAAGEAQMTGSLAVCAGSCGPGNLHLINGLFDAHRSRLPVLAIAAQIPSSEIGGGYFQETHPQNLFRECSHYCELVSDVSQMPYVLENAIRAAVGQRGVAVVAIPGDIALRKAPQRAPSASRSLALAAPTIAPEAEELGQLASMLNDARRITLFCGRGCAGAHAELMQLAEALKSPIVHALGGKDHVEYDNPYDVGMTGLLGFSSGYRATEQCDALLMLGTDFPYRQFYPKDATVLQVDSRGEQIGRRTRVDVPLVGTVSDTIAALLPRLTPKRDADHLERMRAHYRKARERLDDLAVSDHNRTPMHPQFVAKTLDRLAGEDAVFLPDVGTPVIWAARYLHMNGRRRLVGSFNHGTMANALPQAIGVQASHPGRQVITLSGDGGLAMLLGDLITLGQQKLPVKIIVFTNGALSFVELEMKAAGFVNYGTALQNPDFAVVAEALGIHGQRVERPSELEEALQSAFAYDGPALVEVMVARQELSMPPAITYEQVKGFTLYATRTILSGRGDELIDLASTNIRRRVLA
jgi:pyruvate dehydrogenase (quinone)